MAGYLLIIRGYTMEHTITTQDLPSLVIMDTYYIQVPMDLLKQLYVWHQDSGVILFPDAGKVTLNF